MKIKVFNLSIEARRKLDGFKKKKRAYYSSWLLCVLFILSLFAGMFANTKPLIIKYNEEYFFPMLNEYPETTFGGIFESEADYSDEFVKTEIQKEPNWAIYPPIPWDFQAINFDPKLQHPSPPTLLNLLGTDNRGRDVFSRLIYGFRLSLIFALALAFLDAFLGVIVGAIEGFFGGRVDMILQRLIEMISSIPQLYVLILVASIFPPSLVLLLLILAMFGWIPNQALVRVEFLKARNQDYVKAAKALGVSDFAIMRRHILPNALTMVITRFPFSITGAMTGLVSLDFLGLGVPSPTPSFGESLRQGLGNLEAWWIGLSTISVLLLILLMIVFIGEAILDVFDPRRQ